MIAEKKRKEKKRKEKKRKEKKRKEKKRRKKEEKEEKEEKEDKTIVYYLTKSNATATQRNNREFKTNAPIQIRKANCPRVFGDIRRKNNATRIY